MELITESLVNIIAVLAIIAGLAFAGWWAVGLFAVHSREAEAELPEMDAPDGIKEKFAGVPRVLVIFLACTAVAMVAYVLSSWLTGVSY
jgi:hypothetical protein